MAEKRILTIFLLLALSGMIIAQDSGTGPAHQKSHKKKVYVDESDNSIYWPLDMPFWVKLSTSPDETADSFLLQTVSPDTSRDATTILGDGIKLEKSGRQFLRWYNYLSGDTTLLKFYADGISAESLAEFTGATEFKSGNDIYFGKGLVCAISSIDSLSGIEQTYVSIDGKIFDPYHGEISFNNEKKYSLRFYAVDKVGNVELPKEKRFSVDLSAPITAHIVSVNFTGNVLSAASNIVISGKDNLSGIKHTTVQLDFYPEVVSETGATIICDTLAEGDHRLSYYSVDNVGNIETRREYSFYIDKTPPKLNYEISGNYFEKEGSRYISGRSKINLFATDNKIGVKNIEYKVNDGQFNLYSIPFEVQSDVVSNLIAFRASDNFDNISDIEMFEVILDKNPPETRYECEGANFSQSGIIWISSQTGIKLTAQDMHSGVKQVHYKLGNNPLADYTMPVNIYNEGRTEISYWSEDNVGNKEGAKKIMIQVDNTPPRIMETFSLNNIGVERDELGNIVEVFPPKTSLYLAATDDSVGPEGVWYSINDGIEIKYANPIEFDKPGNYKVKLRSVDRVKNEITKEISLIIR